MTVDPTLIGVISAATALSASITGPLVSVYVTRVQIRAAVRSANRQKWIEEFRETVAKFCGQIAAITQVRSRILANGIVTVSSEADLHRFEQVVATATKIKLLIDPVDRDHQNMLAVIDEVLTLLRTAAETDDAQVHTTARTLVKRMSDLTLSITRREWARVQRGF